MEPTWQDWAEWKSRCAAGRCVPEVQSALHAFASVRFAGLLDRYDQRMGSRPGLRGTPPPADCWHMLEAAMHIPGPRGGTQTKDWVFARVRGPAGDPKRTVEAGLFLILRDVVRDYFRQEGTPPATMSMDAAPDGRTPDGFTLAELLPVTDADPARQAHARDVQDLGQAAAEALFLRMDRRSRLVAWAKSAGISLAHPGLEAEAGCRRSVLHDAWRALVRTVTTHLRAACPAEPPDVLTTLALATFEGLADRARAWARSEKLRPDSFV